MAAEMIRDEADITTTTNTTNAPQTQIELADKTVFTYIDFLIMDFEHEAKELREERPLLKSSNFKVPPVNCVKPFKSSGQFTQKESR